MQQALVSETSIGRPLSLKQNLLCKNVANEGVVNTNFFHWATDPIAFSFGPVQVRWYGICFAMAFVVGYQLMDWIFRKEGKPQEDLESMFTYMFVATLIGARLGHCLFYEPGYYLSHPLDILKFWHGGLASHGAAIAILVGLYLYAKKRDNQPYIWVLARMCMLVALGGFFIRTGNFFNSEIIGKPSSLPWAVVFTRLDSIPRHPSQLYEAFSYLLIFIGLIQLYRREGPRD